MARLTVNELVRLKGKRAVTLTTAFDAETAKACELGGVDILVTYAPITDTVDELLLNIKKVRSGAPNTMIGVGLPVSPAYVSDERAIETALCAIKAGGDLVYSSGNHVNRFRAMADLKIPCVGHVGLIPIHSTWFGGLRSVGKTAEEATRVFEETIALQEAGAIAVEMECVPHRVAEEVTKRVDVLVFSIGSGPRCDGQFVFSCDLLGMHDGHYPRHAVTYCRFFEDAVRAFRRYAREVREGIFPTTANGFSISEQEFDVFLRNIGDRELATAPASGSVQSGGSAADRVRDLTE